MRVRVADPQIGVLQAREAGVAGVLGGGRRAHRHLAAKRTARRSASRAARKSRRRQSCGKRRRAPIRARSSSEAALIGREIVPQAATRRARAPAPAAPAPAGTSKAAVRDRRSPAAPRMPARVQLAEAAALAAHLGAVAQPTSSNQPMMPPPATNELEIQLLVDRNAVLAAVALVVVDEPPHVERLDELAAARRRTRWRRAASRTACSPSG